MEPKWSQNGAKQQHELKNCLWGLKLAPRWPPGPLNREGVVLFFDVFKKKGVQKGSLGGPNENWGATKRPFLQKSRARATFSFYFLAVLLRVAFLIVCCTNIRRTFDANCLFFLVVFLRRSLVKSLGFCMPSPRRFSHLLALKQTWRPSRYIVFYSVFCNFSFFHFSKFENLKRKITPKWLPEKTQKIIKKYEQTDYFFTPFFLSRKVAVWYPKLSQNAPLGGPGGQKWRPEGPKSGKRGEINFCEKVVF